MSIRMKFGENIAMKRKVTSCFTFLYILCTANADHAHRVVSFKNISEQNILWRQTYSTKVECVGACFRIQKCLCVQFSLNGSCVGLEVKLVKHNTTGDWATTEEFYVMDKAPPCGEPPSYPEAVVDVYTAGDGTGEKAVYSCTSGFRSCTNTLTRRCFAGKWETEEVKCDKTTWLIPHGVYENRFKHDLPCGPKDIISVIIRAKITGRRMRCFFMRNADILFYVTNEIKVDGSSVNIYSAKLRGRWKGKITRPGIFPRTRPFSFSIMLVNGVYAVSVDFVVLHEFKEVERGGKPTSFRVQYDIDIDSVVFE